MASSTEDPAIARFLKAVREFNDASRALEEAGYTFPVFTVHNLTRPRISGWHMMKKHEGDEHGLRG